MNRKQSRIVYGLVLVALMALATALVSTGNLYEVSLLAGR